MCQGQGSGPEVAHGGDGKKEAGQKSTELGTRRAAGRRKGAPKVSMESWVKTRHGGIHL